MSSAVVSTSAALGRPFVFADETEAEVRLLAGANKKPAGQQLITSFVTPASQLEIRPAPEMISSGISAIDALTGGLPRGCLTEVCGSASSGRTTVMLAALAAATGRGEFCVVVDASDALDPHSAVAAGVELDRLLWVRCGDNSPQRQRATENTISKNQSSDGCPISRASLAREVGISQTAFNFARTRSKENGLTENRSTENGLTENGSRQSDHRLEQVLRATDLLLESGGFGLIVLDLGDLPFQAARRIPLTTWFRFRRAVENKHTILLAIEQQPIAGSCSSLLLQLGDQSAAAPDNIGPTHAQLLTGLGITAELTRSRLDRKPARSVMFETKTAWAG